MSRKDSLFTVCRLDQRVRVGAGLRLGQPLGRVTVLTLTHPVEAGATWQHNGASGRAPSASLPNPKDERPQLPAKVAKISIAPLAEVTEVRNVPPDR